MKISNIDNKPSVTKKSEIRKSGGGSFSSHLFEADSVKNIPSSSGVTPVFAVNSLFALQEVDNDLIPQKKMVVRGFDMVEHLDEIRMGLLTGKVPLSLLQNLDELLKQWRDADTDSSLKEIIDEIELRAAVELAKLEV